MLFLALVLMSAQTPAPASTPVPQRMVVLLTAHEGLTLAEADRLAGRLSQALGEATLPQAMGPGEASEKLGRKRVDACDSKPACVAQLGRTLGVGAVVMLETRKIFDELPIRISVLNAKDGHPTLERSYTVAADRQAELDAVFRGVALEISRALAAPDVPRQEPPPQLVPQRAPAPQPGLALGGPTLPPVRLLTGGAAVASGLASATLLVLGFSEARRAEAKNPNDPNVSNLPYREAATARDHANLDFVLSGVLGGLMVALGITTTVVSSSPASAR